MGTDWSPVSQIYFFTLHSTNPRYDVMELKSLEDWVVEKSFGESGAKRRRCRQFRRNPTREYQVRIDPRQIDFPTGLPSAQVEQQLRNNNFTNAGGSFLESGLHADRRPGSGSGHQRPRHRTLHRAYDQDGHRRFKVETLRSLNRVRQNPPGAKLVRAIQGTSPGRKNRR